MSNRVVKVGDTEYLVNVYSEHVCIDEWIKGSYQGQYVYPIGVAQVIFEVMKARATEG